MPKILVSFPEGRLGKTLIPLLEAGLRQQYAAHFPAAGRALIAWIEIPRGQSYTEGRPADGAWLMIEVADGLAQAAREKAMLALGADFARASGVKLERLMVTLCDTALFQEYLRANSARMRPLPRIGWMLRTAGRLVSSRRRDGYASIGANF